MEQIYREKLKNNPDALVTPAQAAKIMGVSRQRVYQLINHPDHSQRLPKIFNEVTWKPRLRLSDVLSFEGREKYRGKRGKSGTGRS